MIQLTDELIFAEGGRRYCFVHPDDPDKCIKILSPNGDPRKRRKEAIWYKKLRPLSMFDDNARELKSFQDLAKKGEAVWDHFPRCYGIEETSRGPGIATDLIRDADGAISKTVRQYVKANGKAEELESALTEFLCFLREHRIITRDILDHNLAVRCGNDEKLDVIMFDGFGSVEVIPFTRWFSHLAKSKVERKIERFIGRYGFQNVGQLSS